MLGLVRISFTLVGMVLAAVLASMQVGAQDEEASAKGAVLVAGASGRTGRFIVAQLVDAGYDVRAMTRNIERAKEKTGEDYNWVEGDVRDMDSLRAALDGINKVVCAIGSIPSEKDTTNYPEFLEYGGVKNLVDAAKEEGVTHFSLMSSAGVTHEDHMLNRLANKVLLWKMKGEDYLRSSALSYTVVRPGGLRDHPHGEYGIYFDQGDLELGGQISRHDVAAVLVASLSNPDAAGKTFEAFNYLANKNDRWKDEGFAVLTLDN
jgi:uncharacterized protein YbjT (DUF2867 family)